MGAKKSLPPKPKKIQSDMRLELRNLPKKPEPSMDIAWTALDSLDTPDMEQPDFAWPTNQEEESHPNQVSLQEEVSWNNNPQMLDQLFRGSLLEEEQQVEEMQLVEQEEIYTFEVDDQNNLELLNPEQQDMVQNALQE